MPEATIGGEQEGSTRLDVDGIAPLGDRQTVRVSGRAAVPKQSVEAPAGRGGSRWPPGISTSIVAVPLEEVHGFAEAARSTGAEETGR